MACQVAAVIKNPRDNAGDARDLGSIPGSGRSPGGGNGNPRQYTCLENSMDRGAWWDTDHGVTKSRTQLSNRAQYPRESRTVGSSTEERAVLGVQA